MKRHPAFVGLSRDHHDGLLLALRLQQGKKALERLWSHEPEWQARAVVDFFDRHLVEHFQIEESILFPEVVALLKPGNDLVDALLREHAEMRTMAESLRRADPGEMLTTLPLFGEVLERHIRREERELFPFCETTMSAGTLDALGLRINI